MYGSHAITTRYIGRNLSPGPGILRKTHLTHGAGRCHVGVGFVVVRLHMSLTPVSSQIRVEVLNHHDITPSL